MEAVREVTEWTGVAYRQPNHDYLLDGDRIVAYRPWGTDSIRVLRTQLKIDRRGRKFQKLDNSPFKDLEQPKAQSMVVEVKGSKGNSYFVNLEEQTCTCPGFGFRGTCKHVNERV